MRVVFAIARCALSEDDLSLSSGIDVRMGAAVGITMPESGEPRRAFVLVPTLLGEKGAELDEGMRWRAVPALDIHDATRTGFESFDLTKLVARRLAYVAKDGAPLTFALRKAA